MVIWFTDDPWLYERSDTLEHGYLKIWYGHGSEFGLFIAGYEIRTGIFYRGQQLFFYNCLRLPRCWNVWAIWSTHSHMGGRWRVY